MEPQYLQGTPVYTQPKVKIIQSAKKKVLFKFNQLLFPVIKRKTDTDMEED